VSQVLDRERHFAVVNDKRVAAAALTRGGCHHRPWARWRASYVQKSGRDTDASSFLNRCLRGGSSLVRLKDRLSATHRTPGS